MKTITEFKMLRHKHTLALLTRAAAMGNEYAAGILSHLEKIDSEMQALKVSIEVIHNAPEANQLSQEYYASQDKILVSLIALERQRGVILRAVKVNNLQTVLHQIIPGLNKRGEKNRKHLAS